MADNTKLENKSISKAEENKAKLKAEVKESKPAKETTKKSNIARVEYIKFCYGIEPGTQCSIPRCDIAHMLKQGYIKVLD